MYWIQVINTTLSIANVFKIFQYVSTFLYFKCIYLACTGMIQSYRVGKFNFSIPIIQLNNYGIY